MKDFRNPSLQNIQQNEKKLSNQFERIIKEWNQLIRTFMSKSMGVSLSDNDHGRNFITIRVDFGYEEEIVSIIEKEYPKLDFEEHFRLQQLIIIGEQCIDYFNPHSEREYLLKTIDYARQQVSQFNVNKITEHLFNFLKPKQTDIFGTYFIDKSHIELYVTPIVIFCKMHGLDLDSFIIMVFMHELAHGYSHIGKDKDGYLWENFKETDDRLAESLAQYYTDRCIEKYLYKNSNLRISFDYLLERQSEPYKVHKEWKASFEQVFGAFIEARRNNIFSYSVFRDMLTSSKRRIKKNDYFESREEFH